MWTPKESIESIKTICKWIVSSSHLCKMKICFAKKKKKKKKKTRQHFEYFIFLFSFFFSLALLNYLNTKFRLDPLRKFAAHSAMPALSGDRFIVARTASISSSTLTLVSWLIQYFSAARAHAPRRCIGFSLAVRITYFFFWKKTNEIENSDFLKQK